MKINLVILISLIMISCGVLETVPPENPRDGYVDEDETQYTGKDQVTGNTEEVRDTGENN